MPFDFHVHERVLPAGKYVITTTAGNGNALMTDTSTGYSVIVSAGAYLGDTQAGKPRLVFKRYANQYFHSEIWMRGERARHAVPTTKLEKEVARTNPAYEILASVRVLK